jgi:PHYB activation tagged suppressor 1
MSDVLKNESEVKLQRNALSMLEHPTGNEVNDDNDFDTSSGSDIGEHDFYKGSEFHKINKKVIIFKTDLFYGFVI